MERLEKLVWIITGIVVVVVIVLAKVGPIKSEISLAAVDSESVALNQGNDMLEQARKRNKGLAFTPSHSNFQQPGQPAPRVAQPVRPAVPGQPQPPAPQPQVVQAPAVPGEPGVAPTIYVPSSMRDKYQHIDDAIEALQTAAGSDIDYYGQNAFKITDIAEGSPIANQLGFQPGDIVISVNGYPASAANARQLFDTLKNERHFQVAIDRGGQKLTIPYDIR